MVQILGSLLDGTSMSAEWGTNTITERWLVKMDSPLQTVADVQEQLPAYGATAEPTFTIGISYHPRYVNLKLKSLNSLTPHPEGQPFWIVDVTYETAQWLMQQLSNGPQEDQGRGNLGPKKKIDNNGNPIKYPWHEPPTWSSSTQTVRQPLFRDGNGQLLRHANMMPLVEGMEGELELEVHQFTWNVNYDTFQYELDVRPFLHTVNNNWCFFKWKSYVYCDKITCTENYRVQTISMPDGESPSAEIEHHFVTLNATFLIDPSDYVIISDEAKPLSYFREKYRRVSMGTQQAILGPFGILGYGPIPVNGRGDFAEAPWPFLSLNAATERGKPFGAAVPYNEIGSIDPYEDLHYLDALLPRSSDLTSFVTQNNLVIPSVLT